MTWLKNPLIASLLLGSAAVRSVAQADEAAWVQYLSQDGEITVHSSGDAVDENTPFAIASVGKTLTAVAVLRLHESGDLDVDQEAAELLPEAALPSGFPDLDTITIRHLLTMTSGLPDYYDAAYQDDALANPQAYQTVDHALAQIAGEELLFAPGTAFDYSNTNYVLLGQIIETVTGESYAEALSRLVLRPAGMAHAQVMGAAPLPAAFPNGHEDGRHYRSYYAHTGFGDGGVLSAAVDLHAFYDSLFRDGRLLAPETLAMMQADPLGAGYGMGLVLGDDLVGHEGADLGFLSEVLYDPASGDIEIWLTAEAD